MAPHHIIHTGYEPFCYFSPLLPLSLHYRVKVFAISDSCDVLSRPWEIICCWTSRRDRPTSFWAKPTLWIYTNHCPVTHPSHPFHQSLRLERKINATCGGECSPLCEDDQGQLSTEHRRISYLEVHWSWTMGTTSQWLLSKRLPR